MDWYTFFISIIGSGVVTAIVNGLMNYHTQIRSIKESGLYAKRVNVLDEMMKRMERLHRLTGELVSFFQEDGSDGAENERRKKVVDALNYFSVYYQRNRHYLSKDLSKAIDSLRDEYKKVFITFSYEARIPGERPDLKKWRETVETYQKVLVEKKEEISDDFRKLVGVK